MLSHWLTTRGAAVLGMSLLSTSNLACTDTLEPAPPSEPPPPFDYPYDDRLQLQHLQAKATHNSFHVAERGHRSPEFRYTHAPLDVQLAAQGVRHLELDLHYDPAAGRFDIYHLPILDDESSCADLEECLRLIKDFSDGNRAHHPIVVQIDIKDPFLGSDAAEFYFDQLHVYLRHVWPADRIVTPDEVQGEYATLADAVANEGWPTLGALRGRVLFTMYNMRDGFGDTYTRGYTSLAGRLIFARSLLGDPCAAIVHVDDPVANGELITAAVGANMLVRTHADAQMVEPFAGDTSRLEAALASGAHFIVTDVPAPVPDLDYWVDIPGGTPSRCNPVTAPLECESKAVEDPALLEL